MVGKFIKAFLDHENALNDENQERDKKVEEIITKACEAVGGITQEATGRGERIITGTGNLFTAIYQCYTKEINTRDLRRAENFMRLIARPYAELIELSDQLEIAIEFLAIDISLLLYGRFQKGIPCLPEEGIKNLSEFFVDMIVKRVCAGRAMIPKSIEILTSLIKAAIPDEGNNVYKQGKFYKQKVLKTNVPDTKWTISGFLHHSPAITEGDTNTYWEKADNEGGIKTKRLKNNTKTYKYQPQMFKKIEDTRLNGFTIKQTEPMLLPTPVLRQ